MGDAEINWVVDWMMDLLELRVGVWFAELFLFLGFSLLFLLSYLIYQCLF